MAASHDAARPTGIGGGGWKQTLTRVKDEIREDHVPLLAGGVTFFAFLAIFPAIVAAVTLWGLISTPQQITETIQSFSGALPSGLTSFLESQVSQAADAGSTALGWGLAIGLVTALWSASSGMKGLMNAITTAYDETEDRGFVKLRGTALALTVGAILFVLLLVGTIAAIPVVMDSLSLPGWVETAVQWGRWPLLALAMIAALGFLYRKAPDRRDPRWSWASPGAIVATLLWLLGSAGFAWYAQSLGQSSFAQRYGAFASVVVLLLWFFISALAVLVGAELNAELERQTRRDTTVGEERPMGRREAYAADTVAGEEERQVTRQREYDRASDYREAGDERRVEERRAERREERRR